jgi:hypothetical protein
MEKPLICQSMIWICVSRPTQAGVLIIVTVCILQKYKGYVQFGTQLYGYVMGKCMGGYVEWMLVLLLLQEHIYVAQCTIRQHLFQELVWEHNVVWYS